MNKDQLLVERRPQGDYAVPASEFAARKRCQADAARGHRPARELNPTGTPLVEQVCYTDRGHPDKWRKP
jgi:hypothetical protein